MIFTFFAGEKTIFRKMVKKNKQLLKLFNNESRIYFVTFEMFLR